MRDTLHTIGSGPSRRALIVLGAGAALVAAVPGNAYGSSRGHDEISRQLGNLEREHSARLGVFAHNGATGERVLYRAAERFPMCSVFKTLAVAAVLRDLDHHGEFLAKRIHYTEQDIERAGTPGPGAARNPGFVVGA